MWNSGRGESAKKFLRRIQATIRRGEQVTLYDEAELASLVKHFSGQPGDLEGVFVSVGTELLAGIKKMR